MDKAGKLVKIVQALAPSPPLEGVLSGRSNVAARIWVASESPGKERQGGCERLYSRLRSLAKTARQDWQDRQGWQDTQDMQDGQDPQACQDRPYCQDCKDCDARLEGAAGSVGCSAGDVPTGQWARPPARPVKTLYCPRSPDRKDSRASFTSLSFQSFASATRSCTVVACAFSDFL